MVSPPIVKNDLVFDIGMNNGDDSAYYLSQGYNVVAVEAIPTLAKEVELRLKDFVNRGKIEILNVGIASEQGELDFYVNKHYSEWSSFDRELGTRGTEGFEVIKVKTTTLDQIVRDKGVPYYLKMDIEGYDRIGLESLYKCEEKPKFLSIELYEVPQIELLVNLGYKKFQLIDQGSFLPFELPATKEYNEYRNHLKFKSSMQLPVRVVRKFFGNSINKAFEKQYKHLFDYDHKVGSSGPFAQFLPGKWHTATEVIDIFSHYYGAWQKEYENNKNAVNGFWVDIHATQ
jgi:FkbM family methyltransferase